MFPSNSFNQEPKTNAEIKFWLSEKFGSKFRVMSKGDVNGKDTSEVYRWLRENSELYDDKSGLCKEIPWNYAKFQVDKDGHVVKYLKPEADPNDLKADVERLLGIQVKSHRKDIRLVRYMTNMDVF